MTRVKVCGLRSAEDVRLAAELGAWALGFVLTESPRRLAPARAAELIGGAKAGGAGDRRRALTVAVVAAETADWIADAVHETGADAVQLSAGADGPTVAAVRKAAARLRRRPLVIAATDTPDAHLADLVLLDARAPGAYGGTGRTLDWRGLAADSTLPRERLVLAGGLRPENVAEAVATVRPAAVDVSSGVEQGTGVKDPQRLRDFFAAVEQADSGAPGESGPNPGDPFPAATSRRTSE